MDYETEFENLNKGSETWKPEAGIHKIEIVTEPEPTEYVGTDGKITEQIVLSVKVEAETEPRRWFVSKGVTNESLYGQLISLGRYHSQLKGQVITVIVKESKQKDGSLKRSYTVPEAVKAIEFLKKKDAVKPASEPHNIEPEKVM